jgi:hypothetical protein
MKQEFPKSFKPTSDDMKIIRALEKKLGVGFSQIVRIGIRRLAEQEKVA